MTRARYSDEELARAVRRNITIAGVLRDLGVVPRGGTYRVVRRRISMLGLDVGHFKGQGWSRGLSVPAQTPARPLVEVLVWSTRTT